MVNLVIIAGLPGTGKSTASRKLMDVLGYELIDQNEVRREHGMTKISASKEEHNLVYRDIDKKMGNFLRTGRGVIFDAVNRYSWRRHQFYGIASCSSAGALVLECVCNEKIAKERMERKPAGDKLISDPRDTSVYDKLRESWDNIEVDFFHPGGYAGTDFVSYVVYDSTGGGVDKRIVVKGMEDFVEKVESVLISN